MAVADSRSGGARRSRDLARRLLLPAVPLLLAVAVLGLTAQQDTVSETLVHAGALEPAPVDTGSEEPLLTLDPAEPDDPPESAPDPSDPGIPEPPESPTPEPTPSEPPPPTTPAPTPSASTPSTAPSTPRPAPSTSWTVLPPPGPQPPGQAEPDRPGAPRRGVVVTTGDVELGPDYWNQPSRPASLAITVTNTGSVNERIRLIYTLPAGVSDDGTPGCSPAGDGSYACTPWQTRAGSAFGATLSLRVDGQAWRQLPLNGSVRVETATGDRSVVSDEEGFAILLPSGPPAADLALKADEVTFDVTGLSAGLNVRLANLGEVDGDGVVEILLPDGLSVPELPAGCTAVEELHTRCDLGVIPAGGSAALHLPMDATVEAQRAAPLSGGVVGILTGRHNPPRQVQMSFRISAAAAAATPGADPAPTGSQGVLPGAAVPAETDNAGRAPDVALLLIAAGVTAAVVALVVLMLLRRRRPPAGTGIEARPTPPAAIEA